MFFQIQNSTDCRPSSSPGRGPESDDIQQFTPSSAAKHDGQQASCGPIIPASSSPSKSSPTLQSKRAPGKFPKFGMLDDDLEELTLDGVLAATSKRKSLNARKKAALEQQRESSRRAIAEDDPLDVVLSTPEPNASGKERQAPNALAIFNRTSAVSAPSRRQQHFSKMSGKHKPKKSLTETHAEYAAQEFGHANLKRRNAGSRPAGQKQGRDEPVQQTQVNDNLLRHHQEQANKLSKEKEARYGAARQLPPKEPLAAVHLLPALDSQPADGSDSDDDYVDQQQSVASSSEHEDDGDSADQHGDTTIIGETIDVLSPLVVEGDRHTEDDEGDDELATLRLRKSRTRAPRRVAFESEDEEDGVDHAQTQKPVGDKPPSTKEPSGSLDLAGFGSVDGGFSQLFGETQPPQSRFQVSAVSPEALTSKSDDAFAGLRHQEAGLLPAEALLPSVSISESQALRDKALIAGETEAGAEAGKEPDEGQRYLNSQG